MAKQMLHKDRANRPIPMAAVTDVPFQRFRDNVDMEKLETFLDESDNEKHEKLILMLHDPAYQNHSFAKIARLCHITLSELQGLYTDGMRHLGMLKMASALPQVMGDVAEDAKSRMVVCPRCDGFKTAPVKDGEERACPVCKGVGEVRATGDKHARDLVFETMKMTGQGGPLVNINQNFGQNDLNHDMEGLLKMTQTISLEPKKVREIE